MDSGKQAKVLVFNIQKEKNIGTLIRSAAAFGLSELVVAGSGGDAKKKLATFGSQGTHKTLPTSTFGNVDDAVKSLRTDGFEIVGVEIMDNALAVDEQPFKSDRICFVFGNEGSGLSDNVKKLCGSFVRIKQFAARTASLNVACAASIVFHAWAVWAKLKEVPFSNAKYEILEEQRLIIGTYTTTMGHVNGKGEGVYCAKINPHTGLMTNLQLVAKCQDPAYVAVLKGNKIVAVNESGGGVSVWQYEHDTQRLAQRSVCDGGLYPCHVGVELERSVVTVSGYGGTLVRFSVSEEGDVTEWRKSVHSEFLQGSRKDIGRQEDPHVHCYVPWCAEFGVAVDLGADALVAYERSELKVLKNGVLSVPGGPRHIARHPVLSCVGYVVSELRNELFRFSVSCEGGEAIWQLGAPLSTLPPNEPLLASHVAALVVHPSGKFLFVSNRSTSGLQCSVSTFSLSADGVPKWVSSVHSGGACPRDITLSPLGNFLFVANQNSSNISCFSVDPISGRLAMTSQSNFPCPTPSCLSFLE